MCSGLTSRIDHLRVRKRRCRIYLWVPSLQPKTSSRNNPRSILHTNHSTANALLRSERPPNAPHNCGIMSSQQSTPTAHATPLASPGEASPRRRRGGSFGDSLRGTPAPNISPPARATVKSSRRKSGSFDDDDDDESGRRLDLALLPRASRRNLQRQKRARVVEMHASGKQTTLFLRMRELQQLVRDAVPKARHPSQTDLHKRKAHNALHPRDLRAVDATNPHACKNPSVVVRQHVIVCNFPPLRCVVVWDRLLALLPADDHELADELQRQLADQLYPSDTKPVSTDEVAICVEIKLSRRVSTTAQS